MHLITVASALDHHDTAKQSWKFKEDFKFTASRSIAPIKAQETRLQKLTNNASPNRKSRQSISFKDDVQQNDSPRRFSVYGENTDEQEQQEPWEPEKTIKKEQKDLTREHRAIESTLKNVLDKPSMGNIERYRYYSNFPYNDDVPTDAIVKPGNEDGMTHVKNTAFSKNMQKHIFDNNAEEVNWNIQETLEKDLGDTESMNVQDFLDEIKRKRLNGEFDEMIIAHRQGRRRKLTSQQQGDLLIETLRKKRNYTGDHRGHSSNLQNGIMDMLGKSMFRSFKD